MKSQQTGDFFDSVSLLLIGTLVDQAGVESIGSVLLSESSNNITPLIGWFFLIIFVFWHFFSILVQISEVTYRHFTIASTARLTTLLLNRNVLIVVNRNIISNFSRSGHKSLIFNWNRKLVLNGVLVLSINCWSDNSLVLRKLRSRFLEFNLQILSCDHRSDNVLFVVYISRSFDGFSAEFFLYNGFSFNRFIFN